MTTNYHHKTNGEREREYCLCYHTHKHALNLQLLIMRGCGVSQNYKCVDEVDKVQLILGLGQGIIVDKRHV